MKNARKILNLVRNQFGSENVGTKSDYLYGKASKPILVLDSFFGDEEVEISFTDTMQLSDEITQLVNELVGIGFVCFCRSFVYEQIGNHGNVSYAQSAFVNPYDASKTYFIDTKDRNVAFIVKNA